MAVQGSEIFNTAYIDSLVKKINAIDLCSDLQAFEKEVMKEIQGQLNVLEKQLSALSPIADLLESPSADLAKIVTWISDFIDGVLKPMYQPVVTMTEQVVQYTEAVARLTAAIEAAATRIGECAITTTEVTIPTVA